MLSGLSLLEATMTKFRRTAVRATLLAFMGLSIEGVAATETILKCDARNIHTDKIIEFSVILDESASTATINGTPFKNVRFSQYRIDGESRRPELLIPGIYRETSFKVDRVTGFFSFRDVPDTADGERMSDAQIEALNRYAIAFNSFIGKCMKAEPKF